MIVRAIKITVRRTLRNKTTAFINIGGLAFSMAVALFIGLWINDQLSFNKSHKNYDKIAKLRQNIVVNSNIHTDKVVPFPLADELRSTYASYFKHVVRSSHRMAHLIRYNDKTFTKTGVFLEPEGPQMFSIDIIRGSVNALHDPNSILLSSSLAEAFFGKEDPLQKIVSINNRDALKVAGIYEDFPSNSTFSNVKFIAPFAVYLTNESWISRLQQSWDKSPVQTYVQVADNKNMGGVSFMLHNLISEKLKQHKTQNKTTIFLEPMSKWHLYADYKNGANSGGKIQYVWMFGIIGVFVILLACINFMNLSTARSAKYAKEIGIRKAIGSLRAQLVARFYMESISIVATSFIIAIVIVLCFMPVFSEIAGKKIELPVQSYRFWATCLGFVIVTGVIAGSYPALYLSGFQPIRVLRGAFAVGKTSTLARKVLVVFQFTVSVSLIISTIIISRQIQTGKNRSAGYDPERLVEIYLPAKEFAQHYGAFRQELLNTGIVVNAAMAESTATDIWGTDNDLEWAGKNPNTEVNFPNTGVSAGYGQTLGWQFIAGRDFSAGLATDSGAFVLNEAAVKFMGLKDPVGEIVRWHGKPFTVIGIIKDVIVENPYKAVRPSIYCMAREHNNFLFIKLKSFVNASDAMNIIGRIFKKFSSGQPFDFKFVEEEYDKKFSEEIRMHRLANVFSFLAIVISALGLYGLTIFTFEQRSKEIAIRKVIGASIMHLWMKLSREFVVLVLLACFIAGPLSWWLLNEWLQQFELRTSIEWWVFAVAGMGSLLLAILTISFQAFKTANMNPAKCLKAD
jgi:ABC-type antimicrobial peptide transport system permease subunit